MVACSAVYDDRSSGSRGRLDRPYPSEAMRAYPVSTVVNSVRNDGPACVEAVA